VAITSSASSHVASRKPPSGAVRSSGVVSRSDATSTSAEVQPLWHIPPWFVGNSRPSTATGSLSPGVGVRLCAHWSAQYGQWVATAVTLDVPHDGAGAQVAQPRHHGHDQEERNVGLERGDN